MAGRPHNYSSHQKRNLNAMFLSLTGSYLKHLKFEADKQTCTRVMSKQLYNSDDLPKQRDSICTLLFFDKSSTSRLSS